MRKYLIATHGSFASGIKSSANIILGKVEAVTFIDAYLENIDFKKAINDFMDSIQDNDEVIVLSDMFGGSVNQYISTFLKIKNFYLITGINLPVLLELLTIDEQEVINEQLITSIIEQGRKQIIFVNDILKSNVSDDFD